MTTRNNDAFKAATRHLACPICGTPFRENACTEAMDYWGHFADLECDKCGTTCHVTTKVRRTFTIELVNQMPWSPDQMPPAQ